MLLDGLRRRSFEAAFREVGTQDADGIVDVALTLARLFLMSLQSLHATITPDDLVNAATKSQPKSTVHIGELWGNLISHQLACCGTVGWILAFMNQRLKDELNSNLMG
jgi:hypothetical protein